MHINILGQLFVGYYNSRAIDIRACDSWAINYGLISPFPLVQDPGYMVMFDRVWTRKCWSSECRLRECWSRKCLSAICSC